MNHQSINAGTSVRFSSNEADEARIKRLRRNGVVIAAFLLTMLGCGQDVDDPVRRDNGATSQGKTQPKNKASGRQKGSQDLAAAFQEVPVVVANAISPDPSFASIEVASAGPNSHQLGTVFLDDRELGKGRWFHAGPIAPGRTASVNIRVHVNGKEVVRRRLYLKRGWRVRLNSTIESDEATGSVSKNNQYVGDRLVSANARGFSVEAQPFFPTPKLALQTRHTAQITSAKFSRDGRFIFTAGYDNQAMLWDARSLRILRKIPLARSYGVVIALSPNGQIGACTANKNIDVWDLRSNSRIGTLRPPKSDQHDIVIGPKNRYLLASRHSAVDVFDLKKNSLVHTVDFPDARKPKVAISSGGRLAAVGTDRVTLFDLDTGKTVWTTPKQTSIGAMCFTPDDAFVVSGFSTVYATSGPPKDHKGAGAMWQTKTGKLAHTLRMGADEGRTLCISADGRYLVARYLNHKRSLVWLRLTSPPQVHRTQPRKTLLDYRIHATSPDGIQAVIEYTYHNSSDQGTAILYDAETNQTQGKFHGRKVGVASLAADSDRLLVGTVGFSSWLFDLGSGEPSQVLTDTKERPDYVSSTYFIPAINSADVKGNIVVSAHRDQAVRLWDANTGKQLARLKHDESVGHVAISADERTLISGSLNHGISVWDIPTQKRRRRIELKRQGQRDYLLCMALSPDQTHVAVGANNRKKNSVVNLINIQNSEIVATHPLKTGETPQTLSFSSDGKSIFVGVDSGHTVDGDDRMLRLSSDRLKSEGEFNVKFGTRPSASLSPDDQWIAVTGPNYSVDLFDVASGALLRSMVGHIGDVKSLLFRPNGRILLSGGSDGTVRCWDIGTGDQTALLTTVDQKNNWVAATSEGLFDGSAKGRQHSFFRVEDSLELMPVDHFFNDFYYPSLFADAARGSRPLPFTQMDLSGRPQVHLAFQRTENDSRDAIFRVSASDIQKGRLNQWVKHNGNPIDPATLKIVEKDTIKTQINEVNGTHVTHEFRLSLSADVNRISVGATNQNGLNSKAVQVELKADSRGVLAAPRLRVLTIGIGKFRAGSKIGTLRFCQADAKAMGKLFRDRAQGAFAEVDVRELFNESATTGGILRAIQTATHDLRPQDTFVLFVSSHGDILGQRFYLITHDTMRDSKDMPNVDTDTAVAIDQISDILAKSPVLRRILIFDTCHSGSAIDFTARKHNPFAYRSARMHGSSENAQMVYVLAASAADEAAFENEQLGHGVLTYSLLQDHAALAQSGDVLDWFNGAIKKSAEVSKAMGLRRQSVVERTSPIGFRLFGVSRSR